MFPSLKTLTLSAVAAAGALLCTGCVEDGYVSAGSGSGYYGGGPDVYYVSGSPYSHYYGGPLIVRDGGYYYSRGGSYYRYDREPVRGDYRGDRGYRGDRDYRGDRRVEVENRRTVNNYVVNDYGSSGRTTRRGYDPTYSNVNVNRNVSRTVDRDYAAQPGRGYARGNYPAQAGYNGAPARANYQAAQVARGGRGGNRAAAQGAPQRAVRRVVDEQR